MTGDYADLPLRALSIRQPWAALIIYDGKTIENRSRRHSFRGPVTGERLESMACEQRVHQIVGGIIGVADVIDCVTESDSEWFVGPFGFVIENARPVEFIPCRGMLGFFDWRKGLAP